VAASDIQGLIYDPHGLDVEALRQAKQVAGTICAYEKTATRLAKEQIFALPCEIFIPAARPDTLHKERAIELKARLVVEGANIPATPGAEKILFERGILVVPDFIANAGGIICCSVEFHGGDEQKAFAVIKDRIRKNTAELLERLVDGKLTPREAAMGLAEARVRAAMNQGESAIPHGEAKKPAGEPERKWAWG